jgi:hypothetical protein
VNPAPRAPQRKPKDTIVARFLVSPDSPGVAAEGDKIFQKF